MTTRRRDPTEEAPFGAWVRAHPELDSRQQGLGVTDVDWVFHKYRTHIDGIGTREVHCMLMLEVKCNGAVPPESQRETLAFQHQFFTHARLGMRLQRAYKNSVWGWHFGVYVLSLSATTPENSQRCRWGRFTPDGRLTWDDTLSPGDIVRILGFELRPDTYEPLILRRHHHNEAVSYEATMPLGFRVPIVLTKRS